MKNSYFIFFPENVIQDFCRPRFGSVRAREEKKAHMKVFGPEHLRA